MVQYHVGHVCQSKLINIQYTIHVYQTMKACVFLRELSKQINTTNSTKIPRVK